MRGCEIKQLRWKDIDLIEKVLTVRKSKTEAGERVIPAQRRCVEYRPVALQTRPALRRGAARGLCVPACEASHFDATRPQTSWRTAWRSLTRLITCPACGTEQNPGKVCSAEKCGTDIGKVRSLLSGLRFHDLRAPCDY